MTGLATLRHAPISPLRHLDIAAVDGAARAESRNREVHLPPVSVYRWWARRTEAVNGAILDAIACDHGGPLLVADPFAGGGVIPLAAAIRGHRVYAQDLNPWACHGLHTMLDLPPGQALQTGFEAMEEAVEPLLRKAYATPGPNGEDQTIAHTFRVATADCSGCGERLRLYPHALVSLAYRRERGRTEAFLACPKGHLFEGWSDRTQPCPRCNTTTDPTNAYTARRQVICHRCHATSKLEALASSDSWQFKVVLVERTCGRTRHLGIPTDAEVLQAEQGWQPQRELPTIPDGREAAVLRRHGFRHWHDLYPARQRHVLERLLETIDSCGFEATVTRALRLAALGVAEMAGLASRWDRWYLKSYETMAAHRFNFTTFTAEPNVFGTRTSGRGTFRRRVMLFTKAATWLAGRTQGMGVEVTHGDAHRSPMARTTDIRIVEGSSERMVLPDKSVDVVLTDPPYHDDVQYGELSLPLRAWAALPTSDLDGEAVATRGDEAAYASYGRLLARIFAEARRTLADHGHLVFSYANREPEAWVAVLQALQEAGFRAAGYAIVHSENETDHAKRAVRACSLDLILDLVPDPGPVHPWRPVDVPHTQEGSFLRLVGEALIETTDATQDEWVTPFRKRANAHPFITG